MVLSVGLLLIYCMYLMVISGDKRHSLYCYDWYISTEVTDRRPNTSANGKPLVLNGISENEKYVRLKVWIYDDKHTSLDEEKGLAATPSQSSKITTKVFHAIGQSPRLEHIAKGRQYLKQSLEVEYNPSENYWESYLQEDVTTTHFQHSLKVSGLPVALYDCFVADKTTLLPITKHRSLIINSSLTVGLFISSDENFIRLIANKQLSTAILISTREISISQGFFKAAVRLRAPVGFEHLLKLAVREIVILESYIAILLKNGKLFYRSFETDFLVYEGIDDNVLLLGITTVETSISNFAHYLSSKNILLAWSDERIMLIRAFQSVTTLPPLPTATVLRQHGVGYVNHMAIVTACFNSMPERILVAVKVLASSKPDTKVNPSWKVVFLTFNTNDNTWVVSNLWANYGNKEPMLLKIKIVGAAESALVAHDGITLFYSYAGYKIIGTKTVGSCHLHILTEYIRDLVVSDSGNIAILTTNNRLMYSRTGLREFATLNPLSEIGHGETIWFDMEGQLFAVFVNESMLARRRLDTHTGSPQSCPYHSFSHTLIEELYLLDKGERFIFQVELIHHSASRDPIDVKFQSTSVLKADIVPTTHHTTSGILARETITIYHIIGSPTVPVHTTDKYASAMALLEVLPDKASLMCDSPGIIVGKMVSGCPDDRHVRVRNSSLVRDCTDLQQNIFIESGNSLDVASAAIIFHDRELTYEGKDLGCPFLVEGYGALSPQIDVYDGPSFAKLGDGANFIIVEENGRLDFSYSLSMEKAGCRRRAQTWKNQVEKATNRTEIWTIWGPHNYVSCYEDDSASNDTSFKHKPYEILNNSGLNTLLFPLTDDTLYVFRLIIIDPDYSYCDLHLRFAVRIYGTLPPDDLVVLAAINYSIVFIVLLLLVATYLHYHQVTVKKLNKQRM